MVGTATAISAAVSLAGSIINSLIEKSANDKAGRSLAQLDAENKAYRDRYLNADATQYADVQRLLTTGSDRLRRQTQAAAGTQAVMGGTNASVAAAKEQANQAYADMVSQAAATSQSRKDKVLDNYMSQNASIQNQKTALEQQRSAGKQASIDTAQQSVQSVASSIAANDVNPQGDKSSTYSTTTSTSGSIWDKDGGIKPTDVNAYFKNMWHTQYQK